MGKPALFLIILALSGLSDDLIAGERRGATVIIERRDGSVEAGELIAVKENSILLLGDSPGTDISVEVADIKIVKIIRKSKALSGLGYGVLFGGVSGAAIGFLSGNDPPNQFFSLTAGEKALIAGAALGVIGAVVGVSTGALAGSDKTILIEGKSGLEVRAALLGLRAKARIADFR